MDYNPDFTPVQEFEDLIELPAAVVEDMSTDARLAYKLVKAVKAGSLPVKSASRSEMKTDSDQIGD